MNIADFLRRLFAPPRRHIGMGQMRAAGRLAAKRQANQAIPSVDRWTRQRDRAEMRSLAKQQRSARKEYAARSKRLGGAAGVN